MNPPQPWRADAQRAERGGSAERKTSMKTCTKCGETKPLDAFSKRSDGSGRPRSSCKACAASEKRAGYAADPEKHIAAVKKYAESNREKVLTRQKAYREANRDKVIVQQKAYRESNRDRLRVAKKEHYASNKEYYAAKNKRWCRENKDRQVAAYAARYRGDPEGEKARNNAWKRANKEAVLAYAKDHGRKAVDELSPAYVAMVLGMAVADCPPQLIKVKAAHLQLLREVKKAHDHEER